MKFKFCLAIKYASAGLILLFLILLFEGCSQRKRVSYFRMNYPEDVARSLIVDKLEKDGLEKSSVDEWRNGARLARILDLEWVDDEPGFTAVRIETHNYIFELKSDQK